MTPTEQAAVQAIIEAAQTLGWAYVIRHEEGQVRGIVVGEKEFIDESF